MRGISPPPRSIATVLVAVSLLAPAGCGACEDEPEPELEEVTEGHVRAGLETRANGPPASEACLAFCRHSNGCAEAEGRAVPAEARDCEASCGPGGPHRVAPPSALACVSEPCGERFRDCTRTAMLAHMRGQDVAVFPPICQGLCEKAAYCERRAGRTLDVDCEAECAEGGSYASAPPGELLCVHEPCGPPFEACRRRGGPAAPPSGTAPSPSP